MSARPAEAARPEDLQVDCKQMCLLHHSRTRSEQTQTHQSPTKLLESMAHAPGHQHTTLLTHLLNDLIVCQGDAVVVDLGSICTTVGGLVPGW